MLFQVEGLQTAVSTAEDFEGFTRGFPAKVGQWLKFAAKVEKPIEHYTDKGMNALRVYLCNGDRHAQVFVTLDVKNVGAWVTNAEDRMKAEKTNMEILARACKILDLMDATGKSITDSKFASAVNKTVVIGVKHTGKLSDKGYAKTSTQIWGSAASLVSVEDSLEEQGESESGIEAYNAAKMGTNTNRTTAPQGGFAAGPAVPMPQGELALDDIPF